MRLARLACAGAVLTAAAVSQLPPATPGPETDSAIWSAAEADALTHVRRMIQNSAHGAIRLPPGGLRVHGYRIVAFGRGEDGGLVETRAASAADGFVLLAWPVAQSATTRRGIAAHGDGTVMVCELEDGEASDAMPEVLTGKGSKGLFADVVRQPGTSTSGHFWLWLDQLLRHAQIVVVDGNGEPWTGCEVALVGPNAFGRVLAEVAPPPGPWPVGRGDTDATGRAKISGPACNDLRLLLRPTSGSLVHKGFVCEPTKGGIRVVLTKRAVRAAAAEHNEAAAIATLKNISSAQAQCQATGVIDGDGDGAGEYGYFAELTGTAVVRGAGERKIRPPVLSAAFAKVRSSCAQRNGYLYRIYLPGRSGEGVMEAPDGGAPEDAVDPDLAEVLWCCYAWPATPDSGLRAFFVNQAGDVLACPNVDDDGDPRRAGIDAAPRFDAAFTEAGDLRAPVAANRKGRDGEQWTVVN